MHCGFVFSPRWCHSRIQLCITLIMNKVASARGLPWCEQEGSYLSQLLLQLDEMVSNKVMVCLGPGIVNNLAEGPENNGYGFY